MKKEDVPVLKNKVLEVLPTLQSDVWKTLEISTRDGSRLIDMMLRENLITRTKSGGTYLLNKRNGNGNGNGNCNGNGKSKDKSKDKTLNEVKEKEVEVEVEKDIKHDKNKKKNNLFIMRKEHVPELKNKVLEMLPTFQSDVWKNLNISTRDGSKLIDIMLKENLITKRKSGGTYIIEKLNNNENKDKITPENRFSALLSDDMFSPCCGCSRDCSPVRCSLLNTWIIGSLDEND